MAETLVFNLVGNDRLSRVFDRIGGEALRMEREISRAADDSSASVGRFVQDSSGRLRDMNGRFISAAEAARQLGDGIDAGSRRGGNGLRGLAQAVKGAGAAALGALPALGAGGVGLAGALKGVGAAAGASALPALGALVPMMAGAGAASLTAKLAFSGVSEAVAQAGEDQEKYNELLAKMGPEQREFTKTIVSAKTEFSKFGKEIQKVVLPPFTKALKEADPALKIVKDSVRENAEGFAHFGTEFGKLFASNRFQSALRDNLELGSGFIRQIISPLDDFTLSLLELGAASEPTLDAFGTGIRDLLGQGLPGFFEGLQGGIKGSAAMFRGLFSAVNDLLPAFGELVGEIAGSVGPALGEIFESAGVTGAGAFRGLGGAVRYLKPLFGEVGAAARITSITLQTIGSIASNTGRVVLETLWPSFREAESAVGPLQRLATWLRNNEAAVQSFAIQASNFVIDFVTVAVTQIPNVVQQFRLMSTGVLTALDGIVSGAVASWGWIPGIGDKLRRANEDFDRFKNGFITGLHNAEDSTRDFASKVAPRLQQNKLRMNIREWQTKIAEAEKQLKTAKGEKTARLQGDIRDWKGKVANAERQLRQMRADKTARLRGDKRDFDRKVGAVRRTNLPTKTARVTADTTSFWDRVRSISGRVVARAIVNLVPGGSLLGKLFARGGLVRGYASGGAVGGGGSVRGPGTSTSDSIPAWLSDGEFVVRAAAVRKYGLGLFEQLNAMRLAGGGYASGGTAKRARRQVPGDLTAFTRALWKSASDIKQATKALADDLRNMGRSGRRLIEGVWRTSARLRGLTNRRTAASARIQVAQQFAGNVTSNARSFAALSNVGGERITAGSIRGGLQSKLARIQHFTRYIKILAQRGFSKTLLRQILEMGPEQGYAYASALVGADATTLRAINRTQGQLNEATTSLGRIGADRLYDEGRNAGRGFLEGLKGQKKAIEQLMLDIAGGMTKAIRTKLDMHSPSRVLFRLGRLATRSLGMGVLRDRPVLARAMGRISDTITAGASAAAEVPPLRVPTAGGGQPPVVVNLTVNGALDPLAVARQIQQILRELKRTHGGAALGVS